MKSFETKEEVSPLPKTEEVEKEGISMNDVVAEIICLRRDKDEGIKREDLENGLCKRYDLKKEDGQIFPISDYGVVF